MDFTAPWLDKAANEIDASMFSGDSFENEQNRKALRAWMERWQRGLDRIENDQLLDDI